MFAEKIDEVISKTFHMRSPKGDVGIEIETEGDRLPAGKVTGTFSGKEDGSLRHGMEYVSSPIPAEAVSERIENLANTLAAKGAILNPSYRSSTHIHVNYCDHRWRDVLGTMVAWSLVEPLVFRMLPPGRDGNLFCVSSYDSGDLAGYTDRLCAEIGSGFEMGFRPRGKYSSLNLTRLNDLGTMEYRVFPTSMDAAQIQTWVNWVMNIRHIVQNQADPSFLTMVREAEQQPLPFLKAVFGEVPDYPDLGQYVDFGARAGFELARVIGKHLREPAKKPKAKKALFVPFEGAEVGLAQPEVNFHVAAGGAGGFAAAVAGNRRRNPAARQAGLGEAVGGVPQQPPPALRLLPPVRDRNDGRERRYRERYQAYVAARLFGQANRIIEQLTAYWARMPQPNIAWDGPIPVPHEVEDLF